MATQTMTAENFAELIGKGTVAIDFCAAWCGPCRAFAPIYEETASKHPEVTFAKVDTEAESGLAAAFQIRAIPTLMIFRDGILLFRESGMLPAPALEELLTRVAGLDMNEVRSKIEAAKAAETRRAG